jgi:plasmid stabilization system protein ParE
MEVVFLLAAEQDLQHAHNWVVENRPAKEQSFLHDVESRLEQLARFPLAGASTEAGIAGC